MKLHLLLSITVLVRHLKPGKIHCHLPMNDHIAQNQFSPCHKACHVEALLMPAVTSNTLPMYLMDICAYRVMFKHLRRGSFCVFASKGSSTLYALPSPLYIHPSNHSELTPISYTHRSIQSVLEEIYIKTQNNRVFRWKHQKVLGKFRFLVFSSLFDFAFPIKVMQSSLKRNLQSL